MSAVTDGEAGKAEGALAPLFFQGGPGNLRVYCYYIACACMYLKLNRPTVETKTQERP